MHISYDSGICFTVDGEMKNLIFTLSLLGDHIISNALAAIATYFKVHGYR